MCSNNVTSKSMLLRTKIAMPLYVLSEVCSHLKPIHTQKYSHHERQGVVPSFLQKATARSGGQRDWPERVPMLCDLASAVTWLCHSPPPIQTHTCMHTCMHTCTHKHTDTHTNPCSCSSWILLFLLLTGSSWADTLLSWACLNFSCVCLNSCVRNHNHIRS